MALINQSKLDILPSHPFIYYIHYFQAKNHKVIFKNLKGENKLNCIWTLKKNVKTNQVHSKRLLVCVFWVFWKDNNNTDEYILYNIHLIESNLYLNWIFLQCFLLCLALGKLQWNFTTETLGMKYKHFVCKGSEKYIFLWIQSCKNWR